MIQGRLGLSGVPRAAWVLLIGNTLDNLGLGLFFPILPLFVLHRGGTAALVGIIGASALLGNLAMQAPGGWLADRFPRRTIVIVSMAAYGLAFFVYLLPLPVGTLIAIRFAHAAIGGFYMPAARALLADLTPFDMRATVFGHWQGSSMGGFLIGPLIGGALAVIQLDLVFLSAALACLVGALLLVSLPRQIVVEEPARVEATSGAVPSRLLILILPAVGAAIAWQYMGGVYGAMWVLYMTALGASPLVAGLSISIYSLPVVLLSGAAGRLGDRYGIRPMVFTTLLFAGGFALAYGFTRSIPFVMVLSFFEAVFTLGGMPAVMAEISRVVPSSQQGRAQGLFNMITVAGQALGSLAAGFLFTAWIALPFISIAAVCLVCLAAVPFLGRRAVLVRAPIADV
ncbi:MAG: MFS transporter [Candidatus Dormibacteraceae bacterium]